MNRATMTLLWRLVVFSLLLARFPFTLLIL